MIRIEKLAGALGAEISGIDLKCRINPEIINEIRTALLEHEVIFFRKQDIAGKHHLALANAFGKAVIHPAYPQLEDTPEVNKLINDKDNPSKIELWHTDMTFMKAPPLGSILRAYKIPKFGGDTLFASMSAAYQGLSDKMQSFLSGLTATHDFCFGFKESLEEAGGRERLKKAIEDNPPVSHPIVRTHPESGKKALFVNCLFTKQIDGMKANESRALLQMLYEHAVIPEYSYRLRWEENTIAFWDNRITQHKPINDYFPHYREMHRITIAGDTPY